MHDSIGLPQLSQRTASSPAITLSPYPKFLYFVEVGRRLKYHPPTLWAVVSRYVVAIAAAAAAGIIAAVVLYWDIPYRMQDGKEITIAGRMVCLPHKQGLFPGPQTGECAFGFRGDDGKHYVITNINQLEKQQALIGPVGTVRQFQISGLFTYGTDEEHERYDVVGRIDVDSVISDIDE
jgi:hypothetical protein